MKTRNNRDHATRHAFTLIELLVVIMVIALLVGLLLPALAGARNEGRKAQSMSNMRQIAVANEAYRVEKRDALPVPFIYASNNPNNRVASINMYGGTFCSPAWVGTDFDLWPGERMLNQYTYPELRLPHPREVTPGWQYPMVRPDPPADLRANYHLPLWQSPGDRRAVSFGPTTPDTSISQYRCNGTSYIPNIYWVHIASYAISGIQFNPVSQAKAIRWGTMNYNRINSSRFVIASDMTMLKVYEASPVAGGWPQIPGEFGGNYKSVMGFADGHVGYIEMKRLQTGTFPFSQNGAGSLSYPGFDYSLQMDSPPPR